MVLDGCPMFAPAYSGFPVELSALTHFMRLSLMKAATQVLVVPRAGNPDTWAEEDGTQPLPTLLLCGQKGCWSEQEPSCME